MIRRPPRSTPLSLHDALPISATCASSSCRAVARTVRPLRPRRSATAEWESGCSGHREISRRGRTRSEEHTSELQSRQYLVCRLLLEKKKTIQLSKQEKQSISN